jgi:hypothetical protein
MDANPAWCLPRVAALREAEPFANLSEAFSLSKGSGFLSLLTNDALLFSIPAYTDLLERSTPCSF